MKCPHQIKSKITYEIGSLQPISSPILFRLIKKYGLHIGKQISSNSKVDTLYLKLYSIDKHRSIIDFTSHQFGFPFNQALSLFADTVKLFYYFIRYRKLSQPGFNLPQFLLNELSVPCDEWVNKRNFKLLSVPLKMLDVTMTMGNTDAKSKVPMIMLMKLFLQATKWPPTRLRYLNGQHKLIREGFQELWNRVAKQHHVTFGAQIKSIRRDNNKIAIELAEKTIEFDKLIITCSLTQASHFLDIKEEKTLFDKVQYSPGWRVAFLAKNLPHDAVYSFLEPYLKKNYGPFIQGFYPEGQIDDHTWLYSAGISLSENIDIDPYLKKTEKFLFDEFKGEVIQWISTAFWPEYVPHFTSEEVKNGIYQKLERLQGIKNTYYGGGSFAGQTHATVVEYSYALVDKYF